MAKMGLEPDVTKLTPEQRDKLEAYQQTETQLQTLQDIADMTQEVVNILDDQKKDTKVENLGVLLTDIRESLSVLKDKEAPETPDYAKPVVEAVNRLEKELTKSISKIDTKPEIKVDAPAVNVAPPNVDLKGVEKALGNLPKAFEQAIKLIPKTEIPEQDFTPLLSAWEGISEQLQSIENATRSKPIPGSMAISNLTDLPSLIGGVWYISNSEETGTYKYYGFEDKNGNWYILRKTLATNVYLYSAGTSSYSTGWTDRATLTYASAAATF